MANKKELVEAYSFSRRRLVTAFLSGAPGGREVEPARPGRMIVGGLALAVLMVAGGAIAGQLKPQAPADWAKPGLIVSKQTGAAYVITQASDPPVLHPVINITSAHLAVGANLTPLVISQDTISKQRIGSDIGIPGAPATVPSASSLVQTGWTACTGAPAPGKSAGLKLNLSSDPGLQAEANGAWILHNGSDYWLLAQSDPALPGSGAHILKLSSRPSDWSRLATQLGISAPVTVPNFFVDLFPQGKPLSLASFGVTRRGPVDYGNVGLPAGARFGDLVQDGATTFLLGDKGPVQLTPFAAVAYTSLPRPDGSFARPTTIPALGGGHAAIDWSTYGWPASRPQGANVNQEVCAELSAHADQVPTVSLGTAADDSPASASTNPGTTVVTVDSGKGALVRVSQADKQHTGSPILIDYRGLAYRVDGDAAGRLGYAGVAIPNVPDAWLEPMRTGPVLSVPAALCPVDPAGAVTCS